MADSVVSVTLRCTGGSSDLLIYQSQLRYADAFSGEVKTL